MLKLRILSHLSFLTNDTNSTPWLLWGSLGGLLVLGMLLRLVG